MLGKHPTLYMVSLGCPKNRVDSEVMLGHLTVDGFKLVQDPAEAEVIVVNSCSFIGEAKEESIEAIFEHARYKDEGRCRSLVVAGCLAQRYPEELAAEMPEVDHFVGTGAYDRIAGVLRGERARAIVPDPDEIGYTSHTPRVNSMPGYTAYLKISEGCDNKCAFCIIPTLRGGQRSRPIRDIVEEAERLAAEGVVELSLVAQDLTAYGYDLPGRPRLHELLGALARVPVRWIRIHYAYPRDFPDELIDVLAREERISKYIDMPIQHASDRMLRLMKRGRTRAWLEKLLHKLRSRIPDLVMRTAFIVGFPGETEDDFAQLCDFVEQQRFERAGCFEFSREEGTASFDMPDQVPAKLRHARRAKLMRIQRKISRTHQKAYLGRTIDVLVEGVSPDSDLLLIGRHQGQAPEAIDGQVYINAGVASPGQIVRVQVEQAGEYDLVGGIVGAHDSAHLAAAAKRKKPVLPILGQAPVRL